MGINKMGLDDLLKKSPKLHRGPKGEPYSWQVSDNLLQIIDNYVKETSKTLEVGAGLSTVLFALKGSTHTCVVPFAEEVNNISNFCREHNICIDKLKFEVAFSEDVLPHLKLNELDLILIDGAHGFPVPFIDWYYSANKLKVGGILIIDDTQIWTGHILKMFLMSEPEWELIADFPPRSVVFTKTKEGVCGKNEWAQPFVVQQTVDLLYPDYIDMLLPYTSPDIILAKERKIIKALENKQKMSGGFLKNIFDLLKIFKNKRKTPIDSLPTNILDLYDKIDVDKDTTVRKTEHGVLFDCKSDDPQILLPYSFCGRNKLIRIVINSPCETYLQIYYKTTDLLKYTEEHSIKHNLISNKNELFMYMTDNSAIGQMRIDPGTKRGKYLMESLEITDIIN